MRLSNDRRRIVFGVLLALAVAGRAVLGDNEPAAVSEIAMPVVAPAAAGAKREDAVEPNNRIALERLNREPVAADGIDLFSPKSWNAPLPAPSVATKPAPPPTPTAPPLPFRYVGQLEGKDGLMVFLARGEELLSVKPGERIDKDYWFRSISDDQMIIVYLPLEEPQVLALEGRRQ